jgi:hypothetical protein
MSRAELEHHERRWRHWLARTEELQEEYDRSLAAHGRRYPHLSPVSVEVDFDKSYTGRLIAAKEQWAHRRARTHGQAVLALRGLADEEHAS